MYIFVKGILNKEEKRQSGNVWKDNQIIYMKLSDGHVVIIAGGLIPIWAALI